MKSCSLETATDKNPWKCHHALFVDTAVPISLNYK